jgi:predicted nuclease with TOPRIM domain
MESAEIVALVGAFLTGITGLATAIIAATRSAKKDEFARLKCLIDELQEANERLKSENDRLWERLRQLERENGLLWKIIVRHGILVDRLGVGADADLPPTGPESDPTPRGSV